MSTSEEQILQQYENLKELGDCSISTGRLKQAEDYYRQAAVAAPDEAGPYVGFAAIFMHKGQLDEAENAFNVALRLDPSCAEAYCGLAVIAQQIQDYQEAFDLYLKALENDSDNLTALLGLFQTSCQMGTFSKVIYYLNTYLERNPGDSSVMFCLAALLMKEKKYSDARDMLEHILIIEPDNDRAIGLLEELEHQALSAAAVYAV